MLSKLTEVLFRSSVQPNQCENLNSDSLTRRPVTDNLQVTSCN